MPPNDGAVSARRCSADELAHLIDGPDAVDVTRALGVAPREQTVSAQDDAVAPGMALHRTPQHQRQLEAGPLPWQPDDAGGRSAR